MGYLGGIGGACLGFGVGISMEGVIRRAWVGKGVGGVGGVFTQCRSGNQPGVVGVESMIYIGKFWNLNRKRPGDTLPQTTCHFGGGRILVLLE